MATHHSAASVRSCSPSLRLRRPVGVAERRRGAWSSCKERHGDVDRGRRAGADPQAHGRARRKVRGLCVDPASQAGPAAPGGWSRPARTWTLGQYAMVCSALMLVVSVLLIMRGAAIRSVAVARVFRRRRRSRISWSGWLIKRRINKFNAKFPDAIELLVRGLRSGLPITETMGVVAQRSRPARSATNSARSPTR